MDTSLVHTSLWEIVRLPLVEICIVGALAGLVGVFAVLKRRVFFAESVTHGTFPGAVLGVVVGSSLSQGDHHVLSLWLFAGAFALCVPLAGVMYALARIPGQSSQAAAGVVLTVGFALGYFLNIWFAPLPLKIEGFLAGSVLNVNVLDVSVAFAVLAVVMVIVVGYGKQLVFYAFDEQGFRAAGFSASRAELLILGMVVVTVVAVIPAVGTVLSIALIAAPAAGLIPLMKNSTALIVAAPLAGALIGVVGLGCALLWHLSVGGCIAVLAGVFYAGCWCLRKVLFTS